MPDKFLRFYIYATLIICFLNFILIIAFLLWPIVLVFQLMSWVGTVETIIALLSIIMIIKILAQKFSKKYLLLPIIYLGGQLVVVFLWAAVAAANGVRDIFDLNYAFNKIFLMIGAFYYLSIIILGEYLLNIEVKKID